MPFAIQSGAPSKSFSITQNGQVGIGTDTPTEQLHVIGNVRIEGTIQAGSNCHFDTNTCIWKQDRRRMKQQQQPQQHGRKLLETTHEEEEDDDDDDNNNNDNEDDNDNNTNDLSAVEQDYWKDQLHQLERQVIQDQQIIQSLQHVQTQLLERIQALEIAMTQQSSSS